MKYFYSVIMCMFFACCPLLASGEWDDATVTRIAMSLRGDPSALQMFMNKVASSRGYPSGLEAGASSEEDDDDESLVRYALKSLYPRDQVELTATDILEGSAVEHNSRNVYDIDLSGIDISEVDPSRPGLMSSIVIEYFKSQPLCNLRKLTLPTRGASGFIARIFPADGSQKKYCSLLRIDANSSGITEADLDAIFAHFSAYGCFVRDMSQISGRHDCAAAFLTVECRTETQAWMDEWFKGRMTNQKTIRYRVSEPEKEAPLIISLRTM